MMSALECYQHATHCDGMARAADDEINRHMLYAVAGMWRSLAEASDRHARMIAALYAPLPPEPNDRTKCLVPTGPVAPDAK